MIREEALLLFNGVSDEDELEDAYEEQLFEYKQFFLSKAPIAKLFESRIRKLVKLGEAYDLLTDSTAVPFAVGLRERNFEDLTSVNILQTYQAFQKQKNELKRSISNARSAQELIGLVQLLVGLEKQNAAQWASELENEDDVIVSKEPDPMYLLQAIKDYSQQGGETFAQLKNLENNPPETLIHEMKRLSLLFKKF